tara:strand:+ start:4390 stop:5040 length:651 start_codon:yes stop_codon:yes gene_type:complete
MEDRTMPDLNAIWDATPTQNHTDLPDNPETDPSIPDGEYDAEVLDFRCFLDKTGRWWMKWIMAVRGGLLDGRILVRFVEVKPRTTGFLKQDVFHCLGREASFGGELADIARGRTGPVGSQMVGAVVLARKRSRRADDGTGRTFLDVYINGSVRTSMPPVPALEEPDPFRDAGEPSGNPDPFALPREPSRDSRHLDIPFPDDTHAPAVEEDDDEIPF